MPAEACEEAVRDIDKSSAQPSPEEQLESLRREEAKIEEERELQASKIVDVVPDDPK